ncbi:MAG: SDR family NAD(P)-dependent oxidoreductase [Deltaproteobacteria bacterium]
MRKLALITGGTDGIGKAVAFRLAKEGFDLLITTNVIRENEPVLEIINLYQSEVHLIKSDILDINSAQNIVTFLEANKKTPDVLVLNAALTYRADFVDINIDEWKKIFDANVHYPVFLIKSLLKFLNKGSNIVFTGSLMAIHPHSVSLAYGVTKAAVHALVKNLVKFLAPHEIRINGVAPGFVDTEWQKSKPTEIRNNIENKLASKRFCTPDEITDAYWFLISNNYVNGEILVIDGAYSYR